MTDASTRVRHTPTTTPDVHPNRPSPIPLQVIYDDALSLLAVGLYATALAGGGRLDIAVAARRPGESAGEVLDAVADLVHGGYAELTDEVLTLTGQVHP